ncbi:beta/gamma crystallin domain-containing protein 1 [Amblyraja radiata]|uniref:beta/gamma crystallin domain-containing protein 1 n=1 Tax=Amblyraja radiata TaxID=386614 RepID=UPI001402438A|nr:beta/gamma crystallin domain-containing protein 1 [Amblyraja radiata]
MFQNIRLPSSGKAEEGKRNQVLDYLGGIFGSGRKKAVKQSPAEPSSCVEESPAGSKDVSSSARNSASELLSSASGALVGKEDTSLTPVCVVASVPSDDRSAKEHEAIEFIDVSGDENTSCDSRPLKDGVFVGCDRLREGQYDCESQDQCVDIPPIKEWVLPVSETVRVEHIARPAVLDVNHPKTKANTKLSEASVSLPVNRIGVELKPQGKPRESDQTEQSNQSMFRAFRREIRIHSAPEKASLTSPDLVKQQSPSKKVHLSSDTTRNNALGTGIAGDTHVTEGTTNLLKVNPHPAGNASRQKLNGLVEQDSNAVTGPRPDLGNPKSTAERSDLFLGLRFNSNSSAVVSHEMEKRSPTDSKRGGRKGRRRRSLISDQCGQNAETHDNEEELKENDSGAGEASVPERSPEALSPKPVTSPLTQHKIFPKSVLSVEKSTPGVSKPFVSRKKSSQRASLGATLDSEIDSAFKDFSEKALRAEPRYGSWENLTSAQRTGQGVERISQSVQGAAGDSANNEAFSPSVPSASADRPGGSAATLGCGSPSSDVEAVSLVSNQRDVVTRESGADSQRAKTRNVNSPKGKSGGKNVITSEIRSTVTTRIRLPSIEKKGESETDRSNETEITTEEEETIRVMLPKKKSATSHHQVDFFTTKDLPLGSNLNQTCVGSLKIQIQNKPTSHADGNITVTGKRQPDAAQDVAAAPGAIADSGHKTDEGSKVKADRTKHVPTEEHGDAGAKTASAPVERLSLETLAGMDAGKSDGVGSTETASSALCDRGEEITPSSPVDAQPPDVTLPGVEPGVASRSIYRVDGTAPTLVPAVPVTGAEIQSEDKVTLLTAVLVSVDQADSAKSVSKTTAVEEDSELDQRNTAKGGIQVGAIKDTVLPQKGKMSANVSSDKEEDANHLPQRGRSSDVMAKGGTSEQQSPPMEDVSEAVSKTEEKSPTGIDDKRTIVAAVSTVGELGQGTSLELPTSACQAQSSPPQPQQMIESARPEIKADADADRVNGQLKDRETSPAEGASTAHVGPPRTQAGKLEVTDGSISRLEVSPSEKEAAKRLSDQMSGGPTGDAARPVQAEPMKTERKERETSLVSPLCARAPEIDADVCGNVIRDTESGSNEAAPGPALPVEQGVSALRNDTSGSEEKPPLPNLQPSTTAETVIGNEVPAEGTDEHIDSVETTKVPPGPAQTCEERTAADASEMGQHATGDSVVEHQDSLVTPATDGPASVLPNSPEAQPGKAVTQERPPQSEERSEGQSEARANCLDEQKSDAGAPTRDTVRAAPMNSEEANGSPPVCEQATRGETDTPANVVRGAESGSSGVILEVPLSTQQVTPTPQNNESDFKETTTFQNAQGLETFAAEMSKKVTVEQTGDCEVKNATGEQRPTLTSTAPQEGTESNGVAAQRKSSAGATAEGALPGELDSSLTSQGENEVWTTSPLSVGVSNVSTSADLDSQGAVTLPLADSEAVCLQASTAVDPGVGKDVPADGCVATEFGSTETPGSPVHSPKTSLSGLESGGLDTNKTASSQSARLSEAAELALNEGSSKGASLEQRGGGGGGSEETTTELASPLLSSTPKAQHRETEQESAMPTLSLGASSGDSPTKGSAVEQRTETGAQTSEDCLSAQKALESRPGKVIVNDSFVDDACTNKLIAGLDSTADLFAGALEPTHSSFQPGSEMTASFNGGRSLDGSSDMDSFTETIRRYGSPIPLPEKRQRLPKVPLTPPFAMPPIQENQMSPKKFDPSTFTFGLKKSGTRSGDGPTALLKMQQNETKSKVVKRISAENSLLFTSLNSRKPLFRKHDPTHDDLAPASDSKRSRLETGKALDQPSEPPEEPAGKSDDPPPSTLENDIADGSALDLSNPTSAQAQFPESAEHFSRSNAANDETDLVSEKHSENGLTIPNLKPNLLEIDTSFGAIVDTNALANGPSIQGLDSLHSDQSLPSFFNTDLFSPGSLLPELPEVGIPENEPLRLNSRPGKIVIYSQPGLNGDSFEFFHDVQDATSLNLPSEITIRIVRGCWLLYEKPNYEGSKVVLEEGIMEMADIWGKNVNEDNTDAISPPTFNSSVGSIQRIVKGWCLPEIDLCTELDGLGRKTTYYDEMEEIQTYGVLDPTLSLEVFSGSWLLFEEPFHQGNSYFVDVGQYPCPDSWGALDPYIGSLKPLKMGAMKVEILHEHKVIIYEKPLFKGEQLEIQTDVFSFTGEDETSALCRNFPFSNVGSMKVFGGFWVGYEKPDFRGHQYALEEGEYRAWDEWGGYNGQLQSLRFIQVDLSNPVMIMYNEPNFYEKAGNIEVLGPVPIMEETVHGSRTMSINVVSGTWVAYENTDFTGEQYILEKGQYSTFEDWGAANWTIASIQPVLVDTMDHEQSKIKVNLFSEPELQGSVQIVNMDTVHFPDGFSPKSFEVLAGSWVAYGAENFTGNQYILEEGTWPDLTAIGCTADACIKSVRAVNLCFSTPGITLFARENFEGKRIEVVSELLNLKLEGYDTRVLSVKVNGGTWVAYECSNYRGRQFLLQPSQIPNWHQQTGWHRIGSLRPLVQRRVYFRVRNRDSGAYLTLTGELSDIKMIRAQALEGTGMDDQVWFYQDGYIKSKIAEDCCLDTASSLIGAGSRLGVSVLHSKEIHIWSISSDGVIWSNARTGLVIDIKGKRWSIL